MPASDGLGDRDWGTSLSLRDVLTVLFKRWKMIMTITVVVVTGATALIFLRPKQYVARATLLVSGSRADVALAPTDSPQLVTRLSEEDLNSEVQALKSRQLIEEVLQSLGYGQRKEPDESASGPGEETGGVRSPIRSALRKDPLVEFDQMVLALSRQIEINLIRKTNVIEVSYRSTDPEWATRVVKIFTERYIEHRAERGQAKEAVSFFEGQMRAAEERLRQTEGALEESARTSGFTITKGPAGTDSLAGQKALILDRLAELRNEMADAGTRVRELSSQIANLKSRLATEPERLVSPDRSYRGPEGEVIEQRLAELRLERDALLQDFKPDSRYVRDIDTQIKLAEERLSEVQAQVGTIDGTEINPLHQELRGELLRADVELDATHARYRSLSEQVDRYQTNLDALNRNAFYFENLQREVRAAEDEYLLYRKKVEESRISAAMDKQKLINVTIAQPAQRPLTPEGKSPKTVVLLALLFGVLGGLGTAFGTEFYLDRSFTTGEEMERKIGLVHLASIPEEL